MIHSASSPGCCSQKIGDTHEHATYSMVAPFAISSRWMSRSSLQSDQFAWVTMNLMTPASTAASCSARISASDRCPVASATSFSATISQIVRASLVSVRAVLLEHGHALAGKLPLRAPELRVVGHVEELGMVLGVVGRHPDDPGAVVDRGLCDVGVQPAHRPVEHDRTERLAPAGTCG